MSQQQREDRLAEDGVKLDVAARPPGQSAPRRCGLWLAFLIATSAFLACADPRPVPPADRVPTREDMDVCARRTRTERPVFHRYWREGTFGPDDGDSIDWYSTQLCAMGEPVMTPPRLGVRMRFLWLRTFDPPIAVRVEHTPDATRLVAVQLDGQAGYGPGPVARRTESSLAQEDWVSLKETVEGTGLWQVSARDPGRFGLDGAIWLIEIVEPGRRRVVERWGGGVLAPLGTRLLALSTLNPEPIY